MRVLFVVDTTGRVEPRTTRVLQGSDTALVAAVLVSLPGHRYLPAEHQGQKVREAMAYPHYFQSSPRMRCGAHS